MCVCVYSTSHIHSWHQLKKEKLTRFVINDERKEGRQESKLEVDTNLQAASNHSSTQILGLAQWTLEQGVLSGWQPRRTFCQAVIEIRMGAAALAESSSVHGPPSAPPLSLVAAGASDADCCHRGPSVALSTTDSLVLIVVVVAAVLLAEFELVRRRSLREMCTSFIFKSLRQPAQMSQKEKEERRKRVYKMS